MAHDKKWIQGVIKHPGAFMRYCKTKYKGKSMSACIKRVLKDPNAPRHRKRQALLAKTLKRQASKGS